MVAGLFDLKFNIYLWALSYKDCTYVHARMSVFSKNPAEKKTTKKQEVILNLRVPYRNNKLHYVLGSTWWYLDFITGINSMQPRTQKKIS